MPNNNSIHFEDWETGKLIQYKQKFDHPNNTKMERFKLIAVNFELRNRENCNLPEYYLNK